MKKKLTNTLPRSKKKQEKTRGFLVGLLCLIDDLSFIQYRRDCLYVELDPAVFKSFDCKTIVFCCLNQHLFPKSDLRV